MLTHSAGGGGGLCPGGGGEWNNATAIDLFSLHIKNTNINGSSHSTVPRKFSRRKEFRPILVIKEFRFSRKVFEWKYLKD